MKAKGRFISFLLVVNALFGGYAVGLNSRHVDVVDASLPPYVAPKAATAIDKTSDPSKTKEGDKGPAGTKEDKDGAKPKEKAASSDAGAKAADKSGESAAKPDAKKHHHGKAHSKGH